MTVDLPRKPFFTPPPRALLVDVGFTLTSYDGARVAAIAAERGVQVAAAAVDATEPALRAELAHHAWPQRPGDVGPPAGGPRFFRRILELADAQGGAVAAAADLLWTRHLERNLWSRVLDGVAPALAALRGAGLRLAVISNSEGTIAALLAEAGLAGQFDLVLDSWVEGISKPDPRIFALALGRLGVAPGDAIMVGDSPAADIAGAAAAGVRAALLDPYDLHADALQPGASAARFASFAAFAAALLAAGGA
jgi:HAD superfamily hydrolase (TIGR01509 family)